MSEMSRTLTSLSLALAVAGCSTGKPIPQAPQAVQTERIQSDPAAASGSLRFSAVVGADAQVPLAFRIPGYVIALEQARGEDGRMRDVAEGDRVRKGTVLVRIRSAEYEDRLRQAASQAAAEEALMTKAKLDFDRATILFASQSLTKPDFDSAQAQYDANQSQLRAARAQASEAGIALRDTSVVAPFDGDIVKKAVEPGSFVGSGMPAFVVARTDVVKIVVGVPDTAVPGIKLGQPVDITVDAFGDRAFEARISRIASAADSTTRNFDVEVAIPNRDHVLKVGMVGSLQLASGAKDSVAACFRAPLSAIVLAREGQYGVYVVSGGSEAQVAKLRPVEIGPVVGTDISVAHGLSNGDEVITSGASLLKDGQRVEVVK
jgi:RND family efflux transporter MFP subunit